MYKRLSTSEVDPDPKSTDVAKAMAAVHIEAPNSGSFSPLNQKSSEDGMGVKSTPYIHPDLEDISFGALGSSTSKLPAPIRPTRLSDDDDDKHEHRPSLSDFSDYESSDEETHKQSGPSRRNYVTVSDDDEDRVPLASSSGNAAADDPFADPFADEGLVKQKA